jgi:hypothetical protein
MNRNKVIALAATASLMTASIVIPVSVDAHPAGKPGNYKFKDVNDSHSHSASIYKLANRQIIKGYKDGTFRPNEQVTRGQVASIITSILNIDTTNVPNPGFADVTTANSHYTGIAALVNAGVLSGYGDGSFLPNAPLTRGQMAKILVKAFQFKETGSATTPFVDVNNSEYINFINTLYELGITKGTTQSTFSPNAPVKRGQLASFVLRCEDISKK